MFNSNKDEVKPMVIWAAYDGDILKAVDFEELTVASGADNVTVSATKTLTVTNEYTTVKAFLWDGFNTIVPLTTAAEVTRTATE